MFIELLAQIAKLVARIVALEQRIQAAVSRGFADQHAELAAHDARLTDVVREQIVQRLMLEKILAAVTLPPAVSAILTFEVEGQLEEGEHIEMKVPQNQQGTLSVALKNAAGGPGRVDGVPVWTVAPAGVVDLTPAPDGLSCGVTTLPVPAGVPVQSAIVTFDGDGDLGDGVKDIIATLAITVFDDTSGATVAEIDAGVFTPITPAP